MKQLLLTYRYLWLVLLVHLGAAPWGYGQKLSPDSAALNGLFADFNAPDLTAPTLLDVNTSVVAKPANIRALAGSLLGAASGFRQSGSGIGVEVAPVQLFGRPIYRDPANKSLHNTLVTYWNPINRIARGFTLSGASITDSSSAKVAFGAALVLLDRTDPLLDTARVRKIARQFRQLQLIHDFHLATTSYGDAAGNGASNLLYIQAGLPRTDAALRRTVFDALVDLLAMPSSPTQTPDAFALERRQKLTTWNTTVSSLPPRITPGQLTTLQTGGTALVEAAIAYYTTYKEDFTSLNTATQDIIKAANDEFDKYLWNATIVQAGGGWTWSSENQTWRGLDRQSTGLFLRGALRPADQSWKQSSNALQRFLYAHAQVVGLVKYDNYHPSGGEPLAATADSLNSKWLVGGRLLIGNQRFRVSGEYAVQRLSFTQAARAAASATQRKLQNDIRSATVGAEVRVAEKLWLEFAFGTTYSAGERKDARLLTLASLKYALRNEQRFKTN